MDNKNDEGMPVIGRVLGIEDAQIAHVINGWAITVAIALVLTGLLWVCYADRMTDVMILWTFTGLFCFAGLQCVQIIKFLNAIRKTPVAHMANDVYLPVVTLCSISGLMVIFFIVTLEFLRVLWPCVLVIISGGSF